MLQRSVYRRPPLNQPCITYQLSVLIEESCTVLSYRIYVKSFSHIQSLYRNSWCIVVHYPFNWGLRGSQYCCVFYYTLVYYNFRCKTILLFLGICLPHIALSPFTTPFVVHWWLDEVRKKCTYSSWIVYGWMSQSCIYICCSLIFCIINCCV